MAVNHKVGGSSPPSSVFLFYFFVCYCFGVRHCFIVVRHELYFVLFFVCYCFGVRHELYLVLIFVSYYCFIFCELLLLDNPPSGLHFVVILFYFL